MAEGNFAKSVKVGATSISIPFELQKAADGTDQTGKVAADMTASYWRQGSAPVQISASNLAAITSGYSSGGVKEADSTLQPGNYRLDVPDAAWLAGADWVVIVVVVGSDFAYKVCYQLEDVSQRVAASVTGAVGSVTGNVGGSVASVTADVGITQAGADKVWSTAARTLTAFGFSVTVSTNGDKTGYALSAPGVQAIWDALTSALTTAGSVGKRLVDFVTSLVYSAPPDPTHYTTARADLLDNLNVGGLVASSAQVLNIQNNTFVSSNLPPLLERPDAGSTGMPVVLLFADETGAAHDLDLGNPTILLTNDAGTDLSSRLSVIAHPATGKYTLTYTNSSADAVETLHWEITGTLNAKLRRYVADTQVVDTTAIDFTATDRANLGAIKAQTDKVLFDGSSYVKSDPQTAVTVGAYAAGQDPATLLLVTPADKLATDASGRLTVGKNNDKTGYGLSGAAVQAIWDALTSALGTAGSIGKRLVDFVTTLVYSAPPDPAHYTNARGDNLSNLDASVGSRLAASAYTAPDNTDLVTALADVVTLLGRVSGAVALNTDLQGAITTLTAIQASLAEIEGETDDIAAVKAKTDHLPGVDAGAVGGLGVLDVNGSLPANVERWEGSIPLALSTGLVQTLPQSGAGTNTVTVTLVDGAAAPLPGQRVTIKNEAEDATITGPLTTDINGRVVTHLDNGVYHVLVASTPGYLPLAGQALPVEGTTTETYTLTATTIGPPTAPSTCRVYDYEFLADGVTPVVGRKVSAALASPPRAAGGGLLEKEPITAVTNSSGLWQMDLPQGLKFDFTIAEANLTGRRVTLPAAAGPVTLRSLLGIT